MSKLFTTLTLSLVDRVTASSRAITQTVGRLNDRLEHNNRRLDAMRGRMLEAGAVAYGLVKAIRAPVQSAIEFESAMADIRKVVNFETPQAFKEMGKSIIKVSTRIPMAANGIAKIVAAAGQAGMQGSELLQFAELAAKVGTAFDMSAGQTGESLAKIKTQLNYTVEETGLLADAINHLSNTSASSAPDLVDYMKRVVSIGKTGGFSAQETAAIGSAMIASGAEANVAATSFRNMVKALSKGSSATRRQRGAYKRLGLDAAKVAKSMQKDAVGTVNAVLASVRKLPKHMQQATISDLFGDEARALAPLIENASLLENALASVSQQANYLGSSQKEYEERAKTTANAVQLFRNKILALGISLGSALLPTLNSVMDELGPMILRLAKFAEANPKLTSSIVAVTAGLVGLRVAATAARFSFLWMKGGLLSSAIVGLKGIGGAFTIAGTGLRGLATVGMLPFQGIIAGAKKARFALIGFAAAAKIGGIGSTLAMATAGGTRSLLGLLNPLRLVTASMRALKFAMIGTGIGAILIGIAAAGTAIYNNWSGIKAMFSSFASGFMEALGPAKPLIDPIISGFDYLKSLWDDLMGGFVASDQSWAEFGEAAGRAVGKVVSWFVELPGRILSAIKSIDIGSLIKWPSPPAWLSKLWGGGKKVRVDTNVDGTRATGGSVFAGKTYLVGEKGPELITPRYGGIVHDAAKTSRMLHSLVPKINIPQIHSGLSSNIVLPRPRAVPTLSPKGGGLPAPQGQVGSSRDVHVAFNGDIIIQGGTQATAQDIRREFGREAGALLRSQFSDGAV